MLDLPRDDAVTTIEAVRQQGIVIKMVTETIWQLPKKLLADFIWGKTIQTAEALFQQERQMDGKEIEAADGFAQVFPQHKYHIGESLQKLGHFVGMTRDGVNDAPALKKADVGIAVSGATDAARSAADLVLTAPGLSVIIEAIKESRMIFERMDRPVVWNMHKVLTIAMTLGILGVFSSFGLFWIGEEVLHLDRATVQT